MTKKITALKLQKKNRERVNVYLDGEYAFGLAHVVAGWLSVGQELSETKIAELQSEDALEVAYQRALNFLSYRARASEEIRRNLRKKDFPEEIIDTVIQRLEKHNYINDNEFAQLWVENRSEHCPRGRYALRTELRQKGVPDKVIETALEDLDENDLALRAAEKQARKYKPMEWQDFKKKLGAFLSRRGFSYDIISDVFPKIWETQDKLIPSMNIDDREDSV
ncbi:MAG: hypothetical protein HND51_20215 [Chloroflexi bacterium]|nr:hypothetical protein [Chloroflexota bacterium]